VERQLNPSDAAEPTQTIGMLIHDVARLFRRRFEQVARMRQLGLTRAQAAVLLHLSRNEGINQVSLAQLMEIEPITLVRLLDRLQASGLIERRVDPLDRRAYRLFLVDSARPTLARIESVIQEVREEALARVDQREREALLRLLGTMKTNLLERADEHSEDAIEERLEAANA
jgi:DNA-binding MarR family transcriptional regulator